MKKNITLHELMLLESEVALKWSDDKESYILLKTLRDKCPCAFCSGETDVLGNVYKGPSKKLEGIAYQVVRWERVGHYAVRIYWGDRHADGLYTYDMLRELGDS